jgi:hypothetical protein
MVLDENCGSFGAKVWHFLVQSMVVFGAGILWVGKTDYLFLV